MGQLSIQNVDAGSGLNPTYDAAANDDFIVPDPTDRKLILHVKNGDASTHSVTVDDVRTVSPPGAVAFDPDMTEEVPAGEERFIGLGQLPRFTDDNGQIAVNWSAITGMTVAVLRQR